VNNGDEVIEKLISELETKGEITIKSGSNELFIQAVDDKEVYAYVSSTNREFKDSRDAVEWAMSEK
jgi:hypothetical protein